MNRVFRTRFAAFAMAIIGTCVLVLALIAAAGGFEKRSHRPDSDFVEAQFDALDIQAMRLDTLLPFRAPGTDADGRKVFPHQDNTYWLWGPLRKLFRMPVYLQLTHCYSLLHK